MIIGCTDKDNWHGSPLPLPNPEVRSLSSVCTPRANPVLVIRLFMDTHHAGFPFGLPSPLPPEEKVGALLGSPPIVLDDWV